MMTYATAIRLGTASTEAILRRFNSDVTHPAYAAMLEVGRAQRTSGADGLTGLERGLHGGRGG
jgi:TnpA family transposase